MSSHMEATQLYHQVVQVVQHRPLEFVCLTSAILIGITVVCIRAIREATALLKYPLATQKAFWDISGSQAKAPFTVDAQGVVQRALKQLGATKPFRVVTENGQQLILPPSLANDIRNNDKLSFADYMKEATCAHIPGFEPFLEATKSTLLNDMVTLKLTKNLSKLTIPMSEEARSACNDTFPDDTEWHELVLKNAILDLVARLSARVFLGDEAVRHNVNWLRITKDYTVHSFMAAYELRAYPVFLQSIVHWFLPTVKQVRAELKEAESIITPVLERRRLEKTLSPNKGNDKSDSIEWLEQMAADKGLSYQAAALQLNLAISAIHTTTDLLAHTMYEILQTPQHFQALRDELIKEIGSEGLKHSTLYNLKLMDSVVKEAQRTKPAMAVNMNRIALSSTRLPDGTLIPKGTKLGVAAHASWDPEIFPEPQVFDPYRFLRLREGRDGDRWQLTSTRPEHIAFGHGKHACPGRFLAANEIKILMAHMLMGWEWKFAEGQCKPVVVRNGIMMDSDPTVRVLVKKREAEIEV